MTADAYDLAAAAGASSAFLAALLEALQHDAHVRAYYEHRDELSRRRFDPARRDRRARARGGWNKA